jgi:hypothetical protein
MNISIRGRAYGARGWGIYAYVAMTMNREERERDRNISRSGSCDRRRDDRKERYERRGERERACHSCGCGAVVDQQLYGDSG